MSAWVPDYIAKFTGRQLDMFGTLGYKHIDSRGIAPILDTTGLEVVLTDDNTLVNHVGKVILIKRQGYFYTVESAKVDFPIHCIIVPLIDKLCYSFKLTQRGMEFH